MVLASEVPCKPLRSYGVLVHHDYTWQWVVLVRKPVKFTSMELDKLVTCFFHFRILWFDLMVQKDTCAWCLLLRCLLLITVVLSQHNFVVLSWLVFHTNSLFCLEIAVRLPCHFAYHFLFFPWAWKMKWVICVQFGVVFNFLFIWSAYLHGCFLIA